MKKVAGTLKIDQAQFRELESFSKFSSDLDPVTAMVLDRGRKNNLLLVQPQYSPMPVAEEIALLYCGTHSLLKDVPMDKVGAFRDQFLDTIRKSYTETVLEPLEKGGYNDEICSQIEHAAKTVIELMNI